jgi:hypothetical protein
MPVINPNQPVTNIQVPLPTPVQSKTQSEAPKQVRPQVHSPILFGGENDGFDKETKRY